MIFHIILYKEDINLLISNNEENWDQRENVYQFVTKDLDKSEDSLYQALRGH